MLVLRTGIYPSIHRPLATTFYCRFVAISHSVALSMASYHVTGLNDVHRLLPSEILEDIGIARSDDCLAVVEELASRLASVLGDTTVASPQHALRRLRRPTTANSYDTAAPRSHNRSTNNGGRMSIS